MSICSWHLHLPSCPASSKPMDSAGGVVPFCEAPPSYKYIIFMLKLAEVSFSTVFWVLLAAKEPQAKDTRLNWAPVSFSSVGPICLGFLKDRDPTFSSAHSASVELSRVNAPPSRLPNCSWVKGERALCSVLTNLLLIV